MNRLTLVNLDSTVFCLIARCFLYLIIAVCMSKCWAQHSYMSSTFSIVIIYHDTKEG